MDACSSDRLLKGTAWLPMVTLLALAAFYALLFHRWNAAPVFAGELVGAQGDAQIKVRAKKCTMTPDRVKVTGWAAVKDLSSRKHRTVLVARGADGRLYVIRTELPASADADAPFAAPFGDGVKYRTFAFGGSLNMQGWSDAAELGPLYLAYDTGHGYQLVDLPCAR